MLYLALWVTEEGKRFSRGAIRRGRGRPLHSPPPRVLGACDQSREEGVESQDRPFQPALCPAHLQGKVVPVPRLDTELGCTSDAAGHSWSGPASRATPSLAAHTCQLRRPPGGHRGRLLLPLSSQLKCHLF